MAEDVQQDLPLNAVEGDLSQLTPEGQLLLSFPDNVKSVIREYSPLATKSISELHDILQKVRLACGIAPWHPLTRYMKMEAEGALEGRRMSVSNMWAIYNDESFYTDEQDAPDTWLYMNVVLSKGDERTEPHLVAVSCKRDLLWSLYTERPVKDSIITHLPSGKTIVFKKDAIMRQAAVLLRNGYTCNSTPAEFRHTVRTINRKPAAPALPVPEIKTEEDYKPPMFPFDHDINELKEDHVSLTPEAQAYVKQQEQKRKEKQSSDFTSKQLMLFKLMGEVTSSQLDSIGAKDTASEVRELVRQLTGGHQ